MYSPFDPPSVGGIEIFMKARGLVCSEYIFASYLATFMSSWQNNHHAISGRNSPDRKTIAKLKRRSSSDRRWHLVRGYCV